MTGGRTIVVRGQPGIRTFPPGFRFCQGDSHPDNAIIADLPWPAPAADQPLGGGLRCPPDSGELGIGHAARPVADGERNVAGCGRHGSPSRKLARARLGEDAERAGAAGQGGNRPSVPTLAHFA